MEPNVLQAIESLNQTLRTAHCLDIQRSGLSLGDWLGIFGALGGLLALFAFLVGLFFSTRNFLSEMKAEIGGQIKELKGDVDSRFSIFDGKLKELKSDFDGQFKELKSDFDGQFKEFKEESRQMFALMTARVDQTNSRIDTLNAMHIERMDQTNSKIDTLNAMHIERMDQTNSRIDTFNAMHIELMKEIRDARRAS